MPAPGIYTLRFIWLVCASNHIGVDIGYRKTMYEAQLQDVMQKGRPA